MLDQPPLAEVEPVEQEQSQQAIKQGALPAGEDLDRTGSEPSPQALAAGLRGAAGGGGQSSSQAARAELESLLKQGQHCAQVGGLREPVAPAPFQRLEHSGADAGLLGEFPQPQSLGFAGFPQLLTRDQQGIFGRLGGAAVRGVPPQGPTPGQAREQRGQGRRFQELGSELGHSPPCSSPSCTMRQWPSAKEPRRTGPMATRRRSSTGWPSRAAVRRI